VSGETVSLRDRFAGCLLGGAVGDALGAAVEFMRLDDIERRFGPGGIADFAEVYGRIGAVTDDTQMTLFTAEGLIRAASAHRNGTLDDPVRVIHRAYLRWLHSQAHRSADPGFEDALDGWLIRIPALHSQRAPGNSCLAALMLPNPGTTAHPINDSKGCGGVMRISPIGLWGQDPFDLGCQICALTHGHPSGYLAGGVLAQVIAYVVGGAPLPVAVEQTRAELRGVLNDEVGDAIDHAQQAWSSGRVDASVVESLGEGWVAEEALSIGLYSALAAEDFAHGVRLAVNHGGDSDSTGSIAGNLLGAALGVAAIPAHWLERLELRDEITEIALDLATAHGGGPIDLARYPPH
jgi:ADP-ribosylglycohydrolase